jgi:hypothetical protein
MYVTNERFNLNPLRPTPLNIREPDDECLNLYGSLSDRRAGATPPRCPVC